MQKALQLAIIFAVIGYIATIRSWLLWLNKLNPFEGLLIYYSLVTLTVLILQYIGLVVADINFIGWQQTLGTIMLYYAWHILFNWTSCYVNMVTTGQCDPDKISPVFFNSEDGAVYFLFSKITDNIEINRILTYVVTPFILTFIGVHLIRGNVSLSFS